MRYRIGTLLLLAATLSVAPKPTFAQEPERARRYDQVVKRCARDAERLCPWLDPATRQPRNEVMCLRPYRATVSLGCRRALRAILP